MAFFSIKKTIGTMRLDFLSHSQVVVTNRIIQEPDEFASLVQFAFLFVAKLFVNFPAKVGQEIAIRGRENLRKTNVNFPFNYNESMLGICCEKKITIVDSNSKGKWVYSGELYEKSKNFLVDTKISYGEEEYFHCAAIDTVLETTRRQMGTRGGTICSTAASLFDVFCRRGTSDPALNYQLALSSANVVREDLRDQETPEQIASRKAKCIEVILGAVRGWESVKEKILAQGNDGEGVMAFKIAAMCLPTEKKTNSDRVAIDNIDIPEDIKTEAMWELLLLRFFAVNFGISEAFSADEIQRKGMGEIFDSLLTKLSEVDGFDYDGAYQERREAYREAVSRGKSGLAAKFSELSGSLDNSELSQLGIKVFQLDHEEVENLLRNSKINYEGIVDSIASGEKESELEGAEKTVRIEMGMTVEAIIDLKGKPENHVELGPKTILTYPGLKLIFKDGFLVDVQ